MTTLSTDRFTQLTQPTFSRSNLKSRIVHLGFGAFHRAHQALFTNEMLEKTGSDWGICEINLFGGEELITQLRAQDHLYTVAEKGAKSTEVKLIGSVTESLHPTLDGKEAVLSKMVEEQVAIVSMTITEKGYCADPATGRLDKTNPLIQQDLATPHSPSSAIGYIVEALRLRKQAGLKPFTVMSCDNVQENGHVARAAILDFAQLIDIELAGWIEANVSFPCTMVDRIVPAATPETLQEIAKLIGHQDPCGIACEPFRQRVIEDNFVNGR
ncbi:fructuronate reductase, partial [Vibrio rotiferianus]